MMRRYPAYKDSGVEWLEEVPEGWAIVPVKAVATCNDEVLAESTDSDWEIEYLEISGVDAFAGITETSTVSFGKAASRARRKVKDGDILVSTVRTYLRAIAQVAAPPDNMIASTGFAVLRPRHIDSRFLGFLFRSEILIGKIIARSVGVSYPAINASEIMSLPIPLPPLREQTAISSFLDRETGKIDALVEQQKRLIELLQEKRQAVISHEVTKGLNPDAPMKDSGVEWLGKVPEHWEVKPLRWFFRFVKRQDCEHYPVLSVYRDYGVLLKSSRDDNFNKTPDDLSKYQTVEPGDLVVNKMKAWQGSLGISELVGITSPDYAVFAPQKNMGSLYLNYLLRCKLLPDVYRSISNGIRPSQWRIEPDKLMALRVPLPPGAEQDDIAAYLDTEIAKADALIAEVESAIDLLQERRSALISAAVTGKIDVRGLVDETEAA